MDLSVLFSIAGGIFLLLALILVLKIPAFIALLLTSIFTALVAGMDPGLIMETMKNGMASTLGFVAVVIGLGAIFGGLLEQTGGASALADWMLSVTGEKQAPLALMMTGFLISIPVFFDVGWIILFPVVAALHRKSGKSVLFYAVPLLAGMGVSHAFIPPTPGPLAVAEIMGASLGWIVLTGILAGLPAAIVSGILYGKFISRRLPANLPDISISTPHNAAQVSVRRVLPILIFPLLMIVLNSFFDANWISTGQEKADKLLEMISHPFSALLIANLCSWYFLGRAGGLSKKQLTDISNKSLYPTGIIILVTGAGGVFKQILIDTGAGKMMAIALQETGFSIVVFAFLAAMLVRILQGSATVAMITGAGLTAPLLDNYSLSELQLAALVTCIASGATMASHLNDSGFWLIKEYLGLTEKDAMRTWTAASSILGITGFLMATLIFTFF